MCGRFSLDIPAPSIAEFFLSLDKGDLAPRYNIAPTQPVLGVLCDPQKPDSRQRIATFMRWGLIPSWAKDASMGARLSNARSETLAEKPSFRAAYKYRRCLIPASGFFEWKTLGKTKQPYYIYGAKGQPLAFAGLWEHWSGPQGEEWMTCTIITTRPNRVMEALHDRMPVILPRSVFELWLDPRCHDPAVLDPLLRPCPDSWLDMHPVARTVGNIRNQGPECIEPVEDRGPDQLELF